MIPRVAAGGLVLAVLITSPSLHAQQEGKVARLGLIFPSTAAPWVESLRAFRQRLADLGWIEGKSLVLDFRYADNQLDRLPALAAELVALKPEVIFTGGGGATRVMMQQTKTIPIVFETLGDAVSSGLVPNIARPGGNVTGVASFSPDLGAKQLQLLREIVPRATRVGILANYNSVASVATVRALEVEAQLRD